MNKKNKNRKIDEVPIDKLVFFWVEKLVKLKF